jgi:nitrogen fixation NifU-like protein
MDYFMNPRNVGEMADADGVGDVGNPMCGDIVRLFVKIKSDKIDKATFKTFGCRAAIGDYYLKTRKDQTLSDEVARRIRDPREWITALPSDEEMVVSPL